MGHLKISILDGIRKVLRNMKKHCLFSVAVLLLVVVSTIYIGYKYINSFDYVFKQSKISIDDVLSVKVINKDIIVLYTNRFENGEEGLGICMFNKTSNKWVRHGQRAESVGASRVSFNTFFCSIDNPVKLVTYGYINDPEIADIKVINNNVDAGFAEIINTKWKRIWFKEVDVGGLNIEGYNQSGEKVF